MTRLRDIPTGINGKLLRKYLKSKEVLTNTPFVITPEGKGFFIVGDKRIPEQQFIKENTVVVTSFILNVKPNYDGTKAWLQS